MSVSSLKTIIRVQRITLISNVGTKGLVIRKIMADRQLVNVRSLSTNRVVTANHATSKTTDRGHVLSIWSVYHDEESEIFLNLLFPNYCLRTTVLEAVFVRVDRYSRYTTDLHSTRRTLQRLMISLSSTSPAQRDNSEYNVKKVVSAGSRECVSAAMTTWYVSLGIELLTIPPHGSHLYFCERAHQTLIHMMKATMAAARLSKK